MGLVCLLLGSARVVVASAGFLQGGFVILVFGLEGDGCSINIVKTS